MYYFINPHSNPVSQVLLSPYIGEDMETQRGWPRVTQGKKVLPGDLVQCKVSVAPKEQNLDLNPEI